MCETNHRMSRQFWLESYQALKISNTMERSSWSYDDRFYFCQKKIDCRNYSPQHIGSTNLSNRCLLTYMWCAANSPFFEQQINEIWYEIYICINSTHQIFLERVFGGMWFVFTQKYGADFNAMTFSCMNILLVGQLKRHKARNFFTSVKIFLARTFFFSSSINLMIVFI